MRTVECIQPRVASKYPLTPGNSRERWRQLRSARFDKQHGILIFGILRSTYTKGRSRNTDNET